MHLVDATMFFAPQSGGVKRYLLAKQAWISAHTDIRHTLLVPAPQQPEVAAVTVPAPALPFSGGYRFPLRQAPWRRRLLELQPDLMEAADPYCVPWAALAAGDQLGVPVVGFYHSDMERLLCARLGGWVRPLLRRYLRTLYRRFDLVLAPSRVMAGKLEELGVDNIALQPLGVDTGLFHPRHRDETLRAELGLDPQTRLLVFAGRFSQEKNIGQLIQAFRRLGRPYHLLLIGGREHGRPAGNVTLYPYQGSGEGMARHLASCDALVHAGTSETFGLVIAEAMACGLPVVGVDVGAVPELVDDQVGLLVRRATAADLAEGVRALYERDLAALGRAARLRIEAQFSWDQVLQGLVRQYAHLLGTADPVLEPRGVVV
jgi:alpha-1,6-mannosyltransferase